MDNFVVSARKYRPSTFDTVVGQPSITSTLKNAIRNNQLAQAFLFCGPRGVGKTTCARILAKTINCLNVSDSIEPCNECESCKNFNTSASFNIYELDAASNNSVEDIRNLVDQVRIPPQTGKYKVYIIDEVHMLSSAAFNAFLKTLEEPPAYAKFILATTEKHKIIPTIISRCQIYDFKRISIDQIISHLKYVADSQSVTIDDNSLMIIAQKADGAMRDALSIFDQIVSFSGKEVAYQNVIQNLNVLDTEYYFTLTDTLANGNIAGAILTIDDILDRGFDGQHFIGGLSSHLRNLLMCKDPSTVRLIETSDQVRKQYLEQSAKLSPEFLLKALELNNQFDQNYRTATNKRLHLEILVIQHCTLNKAPSAEPVQRKKPQIELAPEKKVALEKGIQLPPIPVAPKVNPNVQLGKGRVSIKDHAVIAQPKTADVDPDYSDFPKNTFTPAQLLDAWNAYVESHSKESNNYYITLSKRKPSLENGNLLILELDNKIQEDAIQEHKKEILDFLRNRLQNFSLELECRVIQVTAELKAYTNTDKFKKMAGVNPAILKLKEDFDLEVEY